MIPADFSYYHYLILPAIIFCARIVDVTFGTLRVIFISKGLRSVAPLMGFVEVFIWIVVISQIMQEATNIYCYLAYAAGFATGNYVGMMVEGRLAIGVFVLRVTTPKDGQGLMQLLNEQGYGATLIHGQGNKGKVDIIYTVVNRKTIAGVEKIIEVFDPKAFYVIEDVRTTRHGIFPTGRDSLSIFKNYMRVGK